MYKEGVGFLISNNIIEPIGRYKLRAYEVKTRLCSGCSNQHSNIVNFSIAESESTLKYRFDSINNFCDVMFF